MRKIIRLSFGLIFATMICPQGLFAEESQVEIVPKVVLEAEWGNKSGQFGYLLIQAPGEVPKGQEPKKVIVGPACLSVNLKGEIYIFDLVNSRIQKYSKEGKFLEAISIELPNDVDIDNHAFPQMHIDNNGYIYVVGGSISSWFIFSPDGKMVKRIIEKENFNELLEVFKKSKKRLEEGKEELYEKYHPNEKKKEMEWRENRIKSLERFNKEKNVVFLNWGEGLRIDRDDNFYLGKFRINSGIIKEFSGKEIEKNQPESLSEKYKRVRERVKTMSFKLDSGKEVILREGLTGDECISSDDSIYKLSRSFDPKDFSTIKVIKWEKVK